MNDLGRQLIRAAAAGDEAAVAALIPRAPMFDGLRRNSLNNPNGLALSGPLEEIALIAAVRGGRFGCMELLLPHSNPHDADSQGWAALEVVAAFAPQCLPRLILLSDELNRMTPSGTALTIATLRGVAQSVSLLAPLVNTAVEHPFSASSRYQGQTPLRIAAMNGDLDCLRVLLPLSDPLATDRWGNTALICAAHADDDLGLRCLEALFPVSNPFARNDDDRTAFLRARNSRNAKCLDFLAASGGATPEEIDAAMRFFTLAELPLLRARAERAELQKAAERGAFETSFLRGRAEAPSKPPMAHRQPSWRALSEGLNRSCADRAPTRLKFCAPPFS